MRGLCATLATASPEGDRRPPPPPLEFTVIEAALVAVCGSLEAATARLRGEAGGALDALQAHVSSASLEAVKRAKGGLSDVAARVAALRDEIHRYLLDDSDSAPRRSRLQQMDPTVQPMGP